MNIVRHVGKFDWKDTSIIRKAMSKRMGAEFFSKHFDKFKEGAAEQGVGEREAREAWDMINSFGAWAFNKSHSWSYAIVSYWTAYLKAHHPLEFAAANLRNAKDEDSAIELLREMTRDDGIEYVPFDLEKSEINWCAKDGKLYAGFLALKGFGESKASKIIEARNAGRLTPKQLEAIAKAENVFADIFEFNTKYGAIYSDPEAFGVAGPIWKIGDLKEGIPHGEQRVFIGEVIYKNPRNYNEDVNVKKRGGKVGTGPLEFLDLRIRDDSGMIGGRIGRFEYEQIGRVFMETVPTGAHVMFRATFWNGIRYAFIQKWRLMSDVQK